MKTFLRLFLDSNVILSGFLSSQGNPRIILDLFTLDLPQLEGMTGAYNIEEIERNLKKRFPKILPVYKEYFPLLHLKIVPVPPLEKVKPYFHRMSPKDAPVFISALEGKADYIVSGDKGGFPKKVIQPVKLVTPAECVDLLSSLLKEAT